MVLPGTLLLAPAPPSLRELRETLTLFFFRWLTSLPWKADEHRPSGGPRGAAGCCYPPHATLGPGTQGPGLPGEQACDPGQAPGARERSPGGAGEASGSTGGEARASGGQETRGSRRARSGRGP